MVVVLAGATALAARRVVASTLPRWVGAHRLLAAVVVAMAVLQTTLVLAGWLGAFSAIGILGIGLALNGVVALLSSRLPRSNDACPSATTAPSRLEVVAFGAVAIVAVQWVAHTLDAVGRGMTHPDTLWYHMPFAARFVQRGSFTGLSGLGYEAARWFPLTSQAIHGAGIAFLHRDSLSPLINLGWFAVAVIAACAFGDQVGRRPIALLGAAAALGLPVLAATQPGQASSDIPCAAFILSTAVLLRASKGRPVPLSFAGLSLGLALSMKVTIAVPFAVLATGVLVVMLARRSWIAAGTWSISLVSTGSWWFVRDWVGAGTPLPWLDVHLGPVRLSSAVDEGGQPLIRRLFEVSQWQDIYLPGLLQGLTRAWPVVLLAVLGGATLMMWHRRDGLDRVLGLSVVAGLIGYVFTPLTGGLSFVFNLRYLSPMLLLGFVLLVAAPRIAPFALGAIIAASAFASHHERVDAWPAPRVLPALAIVGLALVVWRAQQLVRTRWLARAVALLTLVAVWAAVATTYVDHRYLDAGLNADQANAFFRHVHDRRVAVLGTDETLPMFGLDLSNVVRRADDPPPSAPGCVGWRRQLDAYDYVVLTQFGFSAYRKPAPEDLATDPGAHEVLRGRNVVVYRIDDLHPASC